MYFEKIHNKGQARIFQNHYLEYLTKTHPLVIWALYTPVFILLPYYAHERLHFSGLKITLIIFSGILFWTLFEYLMHRFVFHFISESERINRLIYVLHGNHHEYARDKERLFMPPVPSLIISSSIFILMNLVLGDLAFCFFPGFIFGYLVYGSMHYAIHAWNPPFRWMKGLWRNHHLHHYKQLERGFGVSSTIWDHVFGTCFDPEKDKENSEKAKEFMFR